MFAGFHDGVTARGNLFSGTIDMPAWWPEMQPMPGVFFLAWPLVQDQDGGVSHSGAGREWRF
jgi:hypothetical protein